MRITGLMATVELRDPKSGQVATLEMFDVEFEAIGFGCRGTKQHTVFEVQGSVSKNGNGVVQFKQSRKALKGTK